MTMRSIPLTLSGKGNAYLIAVQANGIQNLYDEPTGIALAFRVTWNVGHNQRQFPPFFSTLHDAGVFPVGTDVSIELIHADSIAYVECYNLPQDKSRIAPQDSASLASVLPPRSFTVTVCPLAMSLAAYQSGPMLQTLPMPQVLPPLTCRYKPGALGPEPHLKPSAYITHACLLRQGDAFQASMVPGGGIYTTPGQVAAVYDGIVMTALADAYAGQIRWFYGAPH